MADGEEHWCCVFAKAKLVRWIEPGTGLAKR